MRETEKQATKSGRLPTVFSDTSLPEIWEGLSQKMVGKIIAENYGRTSLKSSYR
jgi:hypothetical protein